MTLSKVQLRPVVLGSVEFQADIVNRVLGSNWVQESFNVDEQLRRTIASFIHEFDRRIHF